MATLEIVSLDISNSIRRWNKVINGVTWVFHMASLVTLQDYPPAEEKEMIQTNRQGIKNMLAAVSQSKTSIVQKVVFTSSNSAIRGGHDDDLIPNGHVFTEHDWTIIDHPTTKSYEKVKTATEKEGWDYMARYHAACKQRNVEPTFTFTTILPTFVFGPVPHPTVMSSSRFIQRGMEGKDGFIVNVYIPYVDIRDVIQAHMLAVTNPKAANERFLITHPDGQVFMPTVTNLLREEFQSMGYYFPTRIVPTWILWLLSFVDKEVRAIYAYLDAQVHYDSTKSMDVLGLVYSNVNNTIIDAAHSMIQQGMIRQTKDYVPRTVTW